jgi:hypothetical protein
MKNQFLHAPIDNLGDEQFIFRRASHSVNPSELLGQSSCLAEHLAVEAQ